MRKQILLFGAGDRGRQALNYFAEKMFFVLLIIKKWGRNTIPTIG
ncbi:hypothetical protein [Desulfosporosinus sp. FKA]|nr:hypothetical protein [Desulfosporosinus sp. FKA]